MVYKKPAVNLVCQQTLRRHLLRAAGATHTHTHTLRYTLLPQTPSLTYHIRNYSVHTNKTNVDLAARHEHIALLVLQFHGRRRGDPDTTALLT
jgi:hypothetical protein